MELAVDAAQSRQLPEFLERFAGRVARMLNAAWGGVAVLRGRETDLYSAGESEKAVSSALKSWIITSARESRVAAVVRDLPAAEAGTTEGGALALRAVFVPVTASDGERLGALFILRRRKSLDAKEKKLLHALASHAALSLENFRRFSQLEKSKRQWVEDIDAISDYIVVHDRAWRILRTNRSLASHLGVPPVALVGEAMSGLRQIAETGSDLPCPFCRDTQRPREEYVAASAERIFLVSTSRAPGVVEDDTRTIHVLVLRNS
jgi:PAS domain-containing protein